MSKLFIRSFPPLRVVPALIILAVVSSGAVSIAAPLSSAAKKRPVKPYLLEVCLVTGDKLGEMGKPVVFTYQGQEVKVCCRPCKKDFDQEPERYLRKLAER